MGRARRVLAVAVVAAGWLAVSRARGDIITHGSTTIAMDFVTVSAPGGVANPADTHGGGYGSVGYDFRIGTYEVSAAQWAAVNTAAGIGDTGTWTGNQPVAQISWNDAAMFCKGLVREFCRDGQGPLSKRGEARQVE